MSSPSLEQVATFIASDNMGDIIPKLVFLQKQKLLSEEFIEHAKNIALESLTGIPRPPFHFLSWIRPSLLILVSVFGMDFFVKKLHSWIKTDQEARLARISSLHLLLCSIKATLGVILESKHVNAVSEALFGMRGELSTTTLVPFQSFQEKKRDLIGVGKKLSSTVRYMEDQIREQRFYIPDRQILAHIKQIKSDALRRRRMATLPLLVGGGGL